MMNGWISEAQIKRMERAKEKRLKIMDVGAKMIIESSEEPPAEAGVFAKKFDHWEAGKTYVKNEVFTYNGCVGFCRQASWTASDIYPPFSTGTESLYGVRPIPDEDGVYPYMYNMKAEIGMKVREGDKVWYCYQAIDPMLYAPSQIPAHFKEWVEE